MAQTSTDPFASIAQPVASASGTDPFASIATPVGAPPPSPASTSLPTTTGGSVGSGVWDAVKGAAEGATTAAGETIQSLPYVGKEIISPESMAAERAAFAPGSIAEKGGQYGGKIAEPVLEFMLGDEALKGLSLADKIGLGSQITQITAKYPWIGKLLQHGVLAARMGTVGTAQALSRGATLPQALKTGAAVGAGGSALSAATDAAPALLNPFRRAFASPAVAGEAAAQPIAQAGVAKVAPTVGASLRSGIDVQTPLADAKAIYQTVDDAAKTDFKALYDKLDAAQDAAREAAIGSPEEAKAQLNIKNTQDAIDDAKNVAKASGVPDVDAKLKQADAKFTETQANKDFNSKFFGKIVRGNVAHNAGETIDVNKAINVLEDMDKPNKYGPSRLQQTSLGKKGAFELKQYLYDAQKAGTKALDSRQLRNNILKWTIPGAGAVIGAAYELTK